MARHKAHHKPYHEQVPFKTIDGEWVEVDEGIFFVLNLLQSNLGIRTQFSCEGHPDFGQAYILMTAKNARKLENIIDRGISRGLYSEGTKAVFLNFVGGSYRIDIAFFRKTKLNGRTVMRTVWERKRLIRRPGKYAIERSVSNHYGMRTTYRWPIEDTPKVLEALREASQVLHGS